MKRGLVIGKFMPVHQGHIALIDFALQHCDELIVSMSFTPSDPIPHTLRFDWLKKIFELESKIKIEESLDNFDNENLPLNERTKIWARFIEKRFPKIDIVVSSEKYGVPFAQHLGATAVLFDRLRNQIPISATKIRAKPFLYWQYIPEVVRPYFVKKICFYGPESTGKSVMAKNMATHYQTDSVPEVAREIVSSNEFTFDDIIKIAHAQNARVMEKSKIANKLLFCDTDLITTGIYCQHYLKSAPPILLELEREIVYDHYFLFDIDVPWVADQMRDLGERRKEMFEVFKSALVDRHIPYTLVSGNWQERQDLIKATIAELFDL
jgi:HTH-type transcriptional regulator, transcriptional repressor of NAD biosynthesis genes